MAVTHEKAPPLPLSSARDGSEAASQWGRELAATERRTLPFFYDEPLEALLLPRGLMRPQKWIKQQSGIEDSTSSILDHIGMMLEPCYLCERRYLHFYISVILK